MEVTDMPRRNFDPALDVVRDIGSIGEDAAKDVQAEIAEADSFVTCAGGHANPAGAKFCSECGSRMDGEADAAGSGHP